MHPTDLLRPLGNDIDKTRRKTEESSSKAGCIPTNGMDTGLRLLDSALSFSLSLPLTERVILSLRRHFGLTPCCEEAIGGPTSGNRKFGLKVTLNKWSCDDFFINLLIFSVER